MEAKSSFAFSAFEGYSLLRLCPGDFFIAIFLPFRFKLRGPKHIIFYDLPQYPHFYSEMCNMLEDPGRITAISTDMLTCTVIYSRFDALKLGEVVGTSRAERMINTEKTVHMLVSGDTSWGMNHEHYWLSGDSWWNLLSGDRNQVWNVWMNICMRMEKMAVKCGMSEWIMYGDGRNVVAVFCIVWENAANPVGTFVHRAIERSVASNVGDVLPAHSVTSGGGSGETTDKNV